MKSYLFLTWNHFTVPKSCLSMNILFLSLPCNPGRCHIRGIWALLASNPFLLSTVTRLGVCIAEGGVVRVRRLEGVLLLGPNLAAHCCSHDDSNQPGRRILSKLDGWCNGSGLSGSAFCSHLWWSSLDLSYLIKCCFAITSTLSDNHHSVSMAVKSMGGGSGCLNWTSAPPSISCDTLGKSFSSLFCNV